MEEIISAGDAFQHCYSDSLMHAFCISSTSEYLSSPFVPVAQKELYKLSLHTITCYPSIAAFPCWNTGQLILQISHWLTLTWALVQIPFFFFFAQRYWTQAFCLHAGNDEKRGEARHRWKLRVINGWQCVAGAASVINVPACCCFYIAYYISALPTPSLPGRTAR